jgi:hypothetical protein
VNKMRKLGKPLYRGFLNKYGVITSAGDGRKPGRGKLRADCPFENAPTTDRVEMKRRQSKKPSMDAACTNWAEEFFSRMRRGEIDQHHHISGIYLLRCAQEATWREDKRCVDHGEQVSRAASLSLNRGKSVD